MLVLLKRNEIPTIGHIHFYCNLGHLLAVGAFNGPLRDVLNHEVILCERGIRTFETATRNTLDLSAVPVIKHLSHLPIIVDPSHGVGDRRFVVPMARAAVAAGADGILVEIHPDPDKALSDGPQSLTFEEFGTLMNRCRIIATTIGRRLGKSR